MRKAPKRWRSPLTPKPRQKNILYGEKKLNMNKEKIIEIVIFIIVGVVNLFITTLRTGSIKKGVNDMKYRLINYRNELSESKDFKDGQTFNETEKVWQLDKNGVPRETEEIINIQKQIDSSIDCALERILAKFDISQPLEKTQPTNYYRLGTALDELTELHTSLADLKTEFELPEEYGIAEIESYLQRRFDLEKEKIEKKNKMEVIKDEKKEIEQKGE